MDKTSFSLINDLSFVVFDLETTGGNHKKDKIIEIGLIKIQNLKIVKQKDFLIQPEIPVPKFIQKLTNIKSRDLADAPTIEEVIDEILEFMGDSILVAHNTSFDIPFFNSVLKRMDKELLENKSICTNLMTKHLIPGLMNTNLNYMCEVFDISHGRAHRALDDACATAKLLLIFLESFIQRNIKKINHLYYPRNRFELARLNFKAHQGKDKDEKNKALKRHVLEKVTRLKSFSLITLKGEHGVILFSTIIKSSESDIKLIENILSEFNWQIVTIKLVGGIVDAYIDFAPLFKKMGVEESTRSVSHLWNEHLKTPIPQDLFNSDLKKYSKNRPHDFGDFIISNNLVVDQYSIYPTKCVSKKHKLVFRYPIHQKKLLQYLKTKTNKLIHQKTLGFEDINALSVFMYNFLTHCNNEKKEVFFINYKDIVEEQAVFLGKLETFLAKYTDTYQYPKEHI